MSDEATRDETVSRALRGIAVPGYRAGFWDRLDARLAAEPFPGLDVGSLEAEPNLDPVPAVPVLAPVATPAAHAVPDPVLVDLATTVPAVRRRGVALLGAAAVVALAVLALQLAQDGPADLRETATGAPEVTLRAPSGGSTSAAERTEGSTADGDTPAAADPPVRRSPFDHPTASGSGRAQAGAERRGAGSAAGGAGTESAPGAASAQPGAAATPQDTVITWATAVDSGDTATAAALTGPRTDRYYEGLGTTTETAAAEWGEAYGVWAEAEGRRIDVLEATPSGTDEVVVVLLERPAADPADGRSRAVVPVVQGPGGGWLVEPAAFGPDSGGPEAAASPARAQPGRAPVRRDHVFEVPAARGGTYTFVLDRTTKAAVPATEAVDGVVRWDPPDKAMTPGRHLVVVTHVTDDSIVTWTLEVDVTA